MLKLADLGSIDPIAHDRTIKRVVEVFWSEGTADARSIIETGIATIVFGLSVHHRDHGPGDIHSLRQDIWRALHEAGIVMGLEKAA